MRCNRDRGQCVAATRGLDAPRPIVLKQLQGAHADEQHAATCQADDAQCRAARHCRFFGQADTASRSVHLQCMRKHTLTSSHAAAGKRWWSWTARWAKRT